MRSCLSVVMWVMIGIVAIIFIGFIFSSDEEDPEDLKNDAMAMYYAEKAIESRLKAPSTAEFPGIRGTKVRRDLDTFYVKSYVDSQNGFGAMIRSDFEVRVIFVEDKVRTRILSFE